MARIHRRLAGGNLYIRVLTFVLLAYATVGRKAAQVGIQPVFNAEIMLGWGLWLLLESGTLSLVLNSVPAMSLVAFMAWGVVQTVPYVDQYRFDAMRDAVIYGYGLFAFVIAGLLLQSPQRFVWLLTSYRKFVWLLFLIGLPMLMLTLFWYTVFHVPGGVWIIILFSGEKGGDFVVHVAGAFVYLTVLADVLKPPPPSQSGNRKPFRTIFAEWLPVFLIIVALGLTLSVRAASIAFILAATIATVARPRSRTPWKLGAVIAGSVVLLAVSGLHIPLHDGRELSFDQLANNVKSIAGMASSKARPWMPRKNGD